MDGWSNPSRWLVILLIVVLLFETKKIPELAKGLGRGIEIFKNETSNEDEAARSAHKIEEKQNTTSHANTDANIDEIKKS